MANLHKYKHPDSLPSLRLENFPQESRTALIVKSKGSEERKRERSVCEMVNVSVLGAHSIDRRRTSSVPLAAVQCVRRAPGFRRWARASGFLVSW